MELVMKDSENIGNNSEIGPKKPLDSARTDSAKSEDNTLHDITYARKAAQAMARAYGENYTGRRHYMPEWLRERLDDFEKTKNENPEAFQDDYLGNTEYLDKVKRINAGRIRRTARDSMISEKVKTNFRIFVVMIVCFAAYYSYNVFSHDEVTESVSALKQQLPLKIDEFTSLDKADYDSEGLSLHFEKSSAQFTGLPEEAVNSQLDLFMEGAQGLCKNHTVALIVGSEKKVTVLLDADDGSFHREFILDKCKNENGK